MAAPREPTLPQDLVQSFSVSSATVPVESPLTICAVITHTDLKASTDGEYNDLPGASVALVAQRQVHRRGDGSNIEAASQQIPDAGRDRCRVAQRLMVLHVEDVEQAALA